MVTEKNESGVKYDEKKLRWDLLPLGPIKSVIKVLQMGSEKYADENWKSVPDWRRRYYSACMRHISSWWDGETIDPESGESHLTHAICCLIFLWWLEKNKSTKPND